MPFRQHLRSTTDTAVTAVYYEDSAALLGSAIALAGLGARHAAGVGSVDGPTGGDQRQPGLGHHLRDTADVAEASLDDLAWADAVLFGTRLERGTVGATLRN